MSSSTDPHNTVAIIQARMGSTRLPEKVLMHIGEEPMLWHAYKRATCGSLVDEVVIATSTQPGDDEIATFCEEREIPYVRGSETDVLDRYYQTAQTFDAGTVVRLTADCPLLSPSVIDRVIRVYEQSAAPYVTNILEYTHPDGLDVEVFSISALETAWKEATEPAEREHVTVYIRDSEQFETKNVENVVDISKYTFTDKNETLRWTVDHPEDLEFVREVYDSLTQDGLWVFDQQSVLELLERRPGLSRINEDNAT